MTASSRAAAIIASFRQKLPALLGIDYQPKKNVYWFMLAIPELFLLIFILYISFMLMTRHVYHYFEPAARFDFPGSSILYYLSGETVSEEQRLDTLGVESNLIRSILRAPNENGIEQFHFQVSKRPVGKEDLCFICHGELPHSEEKKVRATLNMHTEFTACVTCHTTLEQARERGYTWYNYSGIRVTGRPFGTRHDEQGGLEWTDDHYSKITPLRIVDGRKQIIGIYEGSREARDYLLVREMLSRKQQSIIKRRFHQDIEKEGIFCDKCHADEATGILPFESLGFTDKREKALRSENLSGTVEADNEFFFPSFLMEDSMPDNKDAVRSVAPGPASAKKTVNQIQRKPDDTLNWWQRRNNKKEADL
jgi:hypothetical protein